jgi:fumarate reductase subunit C
MPIGEKSKVKEFVRPVATDWWLKKPSYTLYMIREICGVIVGLYGVFLIILMKEAIAGNLASVVEGMKGPVGLLLHAVVLASAVFHSFTFCKLTPRAIVLRKGEDQVPESQIINAHFGAWAVASIVALGILFAVAR